MVFRFIRPAFGLFSVLFLSFALSACGGSNSVVSDSASPSKQATTISTPATSMTSAPHVVATPAPAAPVQIKPQGTIDPILKQAQAKPGVPVTVPESMRRPFNAEEMKKVMEQLPPEVRKRMMGMQPMPAPSPQPAKK